MGSPEDAPEEDRRSLGHHVYRAFRVRPLTPAEAQALRRSGASAGDPITTPGGPAQQSVDPGDPPATDLPPLRAGS
jgi:hypothetical protein